MPAAIAMKRRSGLLIALSLGLLAAAGSLTPCTLALVSGKAAAGGRALMWKNRDTTSVLNKLMYLKGAKFAFAAVVDSEDEKGGEAWGGLNDQGFAVMNSQASDLAVKGDKRGGLGGNGEFMRKALGECATVEDFEKLLVREKGKWDLTANFGVIDARGGASFFETSRDYFHRFDAGDKRTAPFGYLVRTNFSFTSPDYMDGGGFIRFERISHIMETGRATGSLDARFILRSASRDLVNEKLHSYPMTEALPADPAEPLYIATNDTINRNTSVSAVVFEAAPSPDKAYLATMWVVLGQPVTMTAVPVWPYAGAVPSAASAPGKETAPLNALSRKLVSYLYPDVRGHMPQYMSISRLRTFGGEGVLARVLRIEDGIMEETGARLKEWEAAKPAAADVAAFQDKMAARALEEMREAFPGID